MNSSRYGVYNLIKCHVCEVYFEKWLGFSVESKRGTLSLCQECMFIMILKNAEAEKHRRKLHLSEEDQKRINKDIRDAEDRTGFIFKRDKE